MGGLTAERSSRVRSWTDRRIGALPVLLVVASLIATCAGPVPSPSAGNPSATPAPVGSPEPTSPPQAWVQVDVPDLPSVARLEPTKAGRGGVAVDTTFRLTSLDGRPPTALAARLVADPPLRFTVVSVTGATALLRPAAKLRAGALYRISLTRVDGSVEASWAAQAAGPLRIVETIPGDQTTGVPLDTGIEVSFDQYGVTAADLQRYFTIQPGVAGRFEAAGRTIAFVPSSPLAKGRLYAVTVRHGLPLAGTGQVLANDEVFRFETAAKPPSDINISFARTIQDASTREQAAIRLIVDLPENEEGNQKPAPETIAVEVHRLASMNGGIAAWRTISTAPDWTRATTSAPVSTAKLPRELTGTLRLRTFASGDGYWIQVPKALPAGWYVVTLTWGGIARQTILQVTDIATFALLAVDRSAIWVNSLRTTGPAVGATVSIAGRTLGVTDARGLLVAKTPTTAVEGTDSSSTVLVVVRFGTGSAFFPVGLNQVCGKCDSGSAVAEEDWWRLFSTDRQQLRTTDTVNAWGVVRNRDTGKVPSSVTVTLVPDDADPAVVAPVATATASPDRTGSFAVRLSYKDLPAGSYRVRLSVGSTLISDQWISVGPIVKPAYTLALSTDRHAVIIGTPVKASIHAAFFEGTPVAGTELTLGTGDEDGTLGTVSTDTLGNATAPVKLTLSDPEEQWSVRAIQAHPTLPEEGEISGSTDVAVFRSTAVLDTAASVTGTKLVVTGRVNDVVFGRFETSATSDLWSVDPRGAGRANATVRVQVTERIVVLEQVGTTYDFILKRVRPVYETSEREEDLGTKVVQTAADGSYRVNLSVRGGNNSYQVKATYTDEAGRQLVASAEADDTRFEQNQNNPWLANADPTRTDNQFAVGEAVRVKFTGGVAKPPVARYLFAITQRGLRYVTVGTGSAFRTTFTAGSVPDVEISGVRFNGLGYETAVSGYTAQLRTEDRRLAIKLTPDRARYAPGETASVAIRTLGPDGKPVSASLFVRAVDEKLYAMGAASDSDPLPDLYAGLSNGIVAAFASHRSPEDGSGDGGGDTTGGGGDGRADFRDWLVARLVTTDADGRARISIPLSDDLTSWRVTASGLDAAMHAGIGSTTLAVGLPFFVEATIAPEYLAADLPIIRVRAFGSGLATDEKVRFTVSSDSLPMVATTVEATAFEAAEIALPALSVGTHRVRIAGTAGSGATLRSDELVRTFRVVETRATQGRTTWVPLDAAMGVRQGAGLTTITLVDAGRGRVVPLLQELTWRDASRADGALAAALASRVLKAQFGLDAQTGLTDEALTQFQQDEGGVAIVAYGSVQLDVTALAAMTGDPRLNASGLSSALHAVYDDKEQTRDRRLMALAGLAALGELVLADVRAAAEASDLSIAERVTLALAALYAGDETLARQLERDLLAQHGLRRGPWVRLDAGTKDDPAVQTARLAIVAASLGDPVAADMDAWLAENPPRTTLVSLERALAARGWAMRAAGAAATAAITVDGTRREVAVKPDEPIRIELTPAQAAGARIEPVSGKVLMVTSWEDALDPSSLTPARGQALERTVTPAGRIGSTDTVIVTLKVTLGPDAGNDCWRVTDLVPSGLAPISSRGTWQVDEETEVPAWVFPSRVVGQRVEFCVSTDTRHPVQNLRYVARVVTPGTYRWEPAILQSETVPAEGIAIAATTVTIAGIAR